LRPPSQLLFDVKCTTGKPVPVSLTMDEVREAIGVDFPTNWDSLVVLWTKTENSSPSRLG